MTGELGAEQSKIGSLQATLEKSQQDGDALTGEKKATGRASLSTKQSAALRNRW